MALSRNLREEIASVNRDFLTFAGIIGGPQRNPDETLREKGGADGLALYDRIEQDPHVYAVLQKRKMAVIGWDWEVVPASDRRADRRAADFVREQLLNLGISSERDRSQFDLKGFDGICLGLLDAILKGYAVAEVVWTRLPGGFNGIDRILLRDQRRFNFSIEESGWQLRFMSLENRILGEPVPDRKFIVHTFGDKSGNPYGNGLGSKVFWNVFFKRQAIGFWLTFAERFGSPIPIGEYPISSTQEERGTLQEALELITQGAAISVPQGMTIKFIEAIRTSTINTYEGLCRYQDEQISECILGETGTTNQSGEGGSRARDEVGNAVRLELVRADADLLCETLNRTLATWLTEVNFSGATAPRIIRRPASESLDTRVNRDLQLLNLGLRLVPERALEIYGDQYMIEEGQVILNGAQLEAMTRIMESAASGNIPPDSVLQILQATLGIPAQIAASIVNPLRSFQRQPAPTQPVNLPLNSFRSGEIYEFLDRRGTETTDIYRNQLADMASPIFTRWLQELEELISSGNLTEIQERLLSIFPNLPADEFREIMTNALGAAGLAGSLEAQENR